MLTPSQVVATLATEYHRGVSNARCLRGFGLALLLNQIACGEPEPLPPTGPKDNQENATNALSNAGLETDADASSTGIEPPLDTSSEDDGTSADQSNSAEETSTEGVCGDGIRQVDEHCDHGTANGEPDRCNLNCSFICEGRCPWFVNSATGSDDVNGRDWNHAMASIQAAMTRAESGDSIFVAKGRYRSDELRNDIPLVRFSEGIQLYGGFYGTESTLGERGDPMENPSVLDGEMRLHSIVIAAPNARIDGFRVDRGNAMFELIDLEDPRASGGGIFVRNSHGFQVSQCLISNNLGYHGGGISVANSDGVEIVDSLFTGNIAHDFGGIGTFRAQQLRVENCRFLDNVADDGDGGGLGLIRSSLTLRGSEFSGNSAGDKGAGLYLEGRALELEANTADVSDCQFTENTSVGVGAGIFSGRNTVLTLFDGWFSANEAHQGGSAIAGSTDGPTLHIEQTTFVNNVSKGTEEEAVGATIATGGALFVAHSRFYGNRSATEAAGLSVRGSGPVDFILVNTLFVDNSSEGPGAFVIDTRGTSDDTDGLVSVFNSTFIANRGPDGTSAIFAEHPNSGVFNSVYLGVDGLRPTTSTDLWDFTTHSCHLIEAPSESHFDIVTDPDGLDQYFLQSNSPCMDIGDEAHLVDAELDTAFDWRVMTTESTGVKDGDDGLLDAGFHWQVAR